MPIVKCKPTSPGRRFVEKVVKKVALMRLWLKVKKELVVVITTVTSLPVISVVVTSSYIGWWISSVTKTAYLLWLSVWNMIRTVLQISHC